MALCWIFKEAGCIGDDRHPIDREIRNLAAMGWGDRVSSVKVVSGVWHFFEHIDYKGRTSGPLGPGEYQTPDEFGLANDTMSSIYLAGE